MKNYIIKLEWVFAWLFFYIKDLIDIRDIIAKYFFINVLNYTTVFFDSRFWLEVFRIPFVEKKNWVLGQRKKFFQVRIRLTLCRIFKCRTELEFGYTNMSSFTSIRALHKLLRIYISIPWNSVPQISKYR